MCRAMPRHLKAAFPCSSNWPCWASIRPSCRACRWNSNSSSSASTSKCFWPNSKPNNMHSSSSSSKAQRINSRRCLPCRRICERPPRCPIPERRSERARRISKRDTGRRPTDRTCSRPISSRPADRRPRRTTKTPLRCSSSRCIIRVAVVCRHRRCSSRRRRETMANNPVPQCRTVPAKVRFLYHVVCLFQSSFSFGMDRRKLDQIFFFFQNFFQNFFDFF